MNSGIYDCEGHLTEFLSVGIDATARRQAEIEREAMLAVLHLLNTPDDLPRLIANLCDFFQQWSGCEAAGIRLRDGDDYPYFETRGFPRAFVHAEKSLCGRLPDGSLARDAQGQVLLECMCGNILRGHTDPALPFFTDFGSFWTNSTTTLLAGTSATERQTETRNCCHAAGYESVVLIPLRLGMETFGLLQLTAGLLHPGAHRAGRMAVPAYRHRAGPAPGPAAARTGTGLPGSGHRYAAVAAGLFRRRPRDDPHQWRHP